MSKVLVIATSRKTRGGITSVVLAHEQGQQWKDFHCRWIETHRDKNKSLKLWFFITAFFQYLFLLPFYDIVHIHLSEPPSAIRKLPFMMWAKVWGKKTVVHFHSFSTETTIKSRWAWVYKYLFNHADIIITLSEYWKREVGVFIKTDKKIEVVYNPCPLIEEKTINTELSDEEIMMPKVHSILYAGTITPRKGYSDMIRAFAKIAQQHLDWIIVFAGNGEIENGKRLAEELGISLQTCFLGWCRGEEKDSAFREATIFCLPSYAEGFPMAVLDAWSYGLPVITTPVGGIPDVAKDGENMLLFNPGDIDALAICMERMINDITLRNKIASASKGFANNEFNIKFINNRIGNIYKKLESK